MIPLSLSSASTSISIVSVGELVEIVIWLVDTLFFLDTTDAVGKSTSFLLMLMVAVTVLLKLLLASLDWNVITFCATSGPKSPA